MKQFPEIHSLIAAAEVITIWGHAMPDGDCYGCQIGLRELLRQRYPDKRVYAVGSGMPAFFDRLSPMDDPSDEEISKSLAILVDVSCLRRVEDQRVHLARTYAKFDHHRPNPGLEDFPYPSAVDYRRGSCAEIVADFARERNFKWSRLAAEAIYLGMATDTGKFRYDGVSPHTFAVLGWLKDAGIEVDSILKIAYAEEAAVEGFREFIRSKAIIKDFVCYSVIHKEDYLNAGLTFEKAGSLVNSLSQIKGIGIHALFCEGPDGIYRVELRSNRHYPVQPTAAKFGGGGHLYAAGLNVDSDGKPVDDVIGELLRQKPKEVRVMYEQEVEAMILAAQHAAEVILEVYNTPFDVEIKEDNSPVTAADKKADELIRAELSAQFPEYGFLTEESADTPDRFEKKAIFIIDPVDGTKEFVSRNGQFTTNIALCVDGEIVAGVIHAPTLGITYYAYQHQGAYRIEKDGARTRIHVSKRKENLRVLRSISFFKPEEEAFLAQHKDRFEGEPKPLGAALKFCAIAEGNAEYFYRGTNGTKEWDVAAGDIILSEAGGIMLQPNGEPFVYNRKDVYNRLGYVMANAPENLLIEGFDR